MYLDVDDAEVIVEYIAESLDEDVRLRENYSGRGMFGRTCVGIVIDNPMHVAYACGVLGFDMPQHVDSMGYQKIVY